MVNETTNGTTNGTSGATAPKSDPNRYEPELEEFPARLVALKREIVFGDVDPGSEEVSGFAVDMTVC
jgi:hypothetical protein